MTEEQLLSLGFKEKRAFKTDKYRWFELKKGKHSFITNDSDKKNTDYWIGYMNESKNVMDDYFWFNGKLKEIGPFIMIFRILTGKEISRNVKPFNIKELL